MSTTLHLNRHLKIWLLRPLPVISLDGEEMLIRSQSRDLLIFLALNGPGEYDRRKLAQRLYPRLEVEDGLERQRKNALANLPDEIQTLCIKASKNELSYHDENVWVDVRAFTELAEQSRTLTGTAFMKTLDAIHELYEADLLSEYVPELYGLEAWTTQQRTELRRIRGRILEKAVRTLIERSDHSTAIRYAETWYRSERDSVLTLQYLIWLSLRLEEQSAAISYIEQLERVGDKYKPAVGMTPQDWRAQLAIRQPPGYDLLNIEPFTAQAIDLLLQKRQKDFVGREREIGLALSTFFVERERRAISLYGQRGIGKSALASAIAVAAAESGFVRRTFTLQIDEHVTFDSVLNMIALKLDQPQILNWTAMNKIAFIARLLSEERTLIVLDETQHNLSQSPLVPRVLSALHDSAYLVIAARQPLEGVFGIPVEPFTRDEMNGFSTRMVGLRPANTEHLWRMSRGVPYLLSLYLQAIRYRRTVFLLQLQGDANPTTEDSIEALEHKLLQGVWRSLGRAHQEILMRLVDFPPMQGLTVGELGLLCPDHPIDQITRVVELLTQLTLLKATDSQEKSYSVSGSARAYLESKQKGRLEIPGDFYRGIFNRLRECAYDIQWLDERRGMLLAVFHHAVNDNHLDLPLLCESFIPYLLKRGCYREVETLVASIEKHSVDLSGAWLAQLGLQMSEALVKRGAVALARERLLSLAERLPEEDPTQTDVHYLIGTIELKSSQYDAAASSFHRVLCLPQRQGAVFIEQTPANLGVIAYEKGDYTAAQNHFETAIQAAQAADNLYTLTFALSWKGVLLNELREYQQGLAILGSALKCANQLGHEERKAYVYLNLGIACRHLRRHDEEAYYLHLGNQISHQLGHLELIAQFRYQLGVFEAEQGRMLEAEACLKMALGYADQLKMSWLTVVVATDLARLYFSQHLWKLARKLYREAIQQAIEMRNPLLTIKGLFGLSATILAEHGLLVHVAKEKIASLLRKAIGERLLENARSLSFSYEQLQRAEAAFQSGFRKLPGNSSISTAGCSVRFAGWDNTGQRGRLTPALQLKDT